MFVCLPACLLAFKSVRLSVPSYLVDIEGVEDVSSKLGGVAVREKLLIDVLKLLKHAQTDRL
jgi:hypothetical protein